MGVVKLLHDGQTLLGDFYFIIEKISEITLEKLSGMVRFFRCPCTGTSPLLLMAWNYYVKGLRAKGSPGR